MKNYDIEDYKGVMDKATHVVAEVLWNSGDLEETSFKLTASKGYTKKCQDYINQIKNFPTVKRVRVIKRKEN